MPFLPLNSQIRSWTLRKSTCTQYSRIKTLFLRSASITINHRIPFLKREFRWKIMPTLQAYALSLAPPPNAQQPPSIMPCGRGCCPIKTGSHGRARLSCKRPGSEVNTFPSQKNNCKKVNYFRFREFPFSIQIVLKKEGSQTPLICCRNLTEMSGTHWLMQN